MHFSALFGAPSLSSGHQPKASQYPEGAFQRDCQFTLFKAVDRLAADSCQHGKLFLRQALLFAAADGLFYNFLPIKANVPFHLFSMRSMILTLIELLPAFASPIASLASSRYLSR